MFRSQADIEGGRKVYGREYISALQNRNKTNLLEILGQAPPPVEELIAETTSSRIVKTQISRALRWGVGLTGLTGISGGLQRISQQATNRFMNRVEFELQSLFLPLQGFTRDVLFEYESLINQYPTGAGIGGAIGGTLGFVYLGPIGATIGQIAGSLGGGAVQSYLESAQDFWESGGWLNPENLDISNWDPRWGFPDSEPTVDPTGGLPDLTFTRTYWESMPMALRIASASSAMYGAGGMQEY